METSGHCLHYLIHALSSFADLGSDDVAAIERLACQVKTLDPARYIIREGEPTTHCAVLIDGYAFRQKVTSEGGRQIVALLIPGDPIDFQTLFLERADHNVQALTPARVGYIPRPQLQETVETHRAIGHAVAVNILIEASVTRAWMVRIGRRDARARVAHLLCEFAFRLRQRGLTSETSYDLPMTQEQLGDTLGLTSVHINRTLKGLENDGLLERRGRRIAFDKLDLLAAAGDFSPLYLHQADMRERG